MYMFDLCNAIRPLHIYFVKIGVHTLPTGNQHYFIYSSFFLMHLSAGRYSKIHVLRTLFPNQTEMEPRAAWKTVKSQLNLMFKFGLVVMKNVVYTVIITVECFLSPHLLPPSLSISYHIYEIIYLFFFVSRHLFVCSDSDPFFCICRPVGMPKMEKVYLHNPSSEQISLISISATTAHFHASFFQNRVSTHCIYL